MNIFLLNNREGSQVFAGADFNTDNWNPYRLALQAADSTSTIDLVEEPSPTEYDLLSAYLKINQTGYDRLPLGFIDWVSVSSESPVDDTARFCKGVFEQVRLRYHTARVIDLATTDPRIYFLGRSPRIAV